MKLDDEINIAFLALMSRCRLLSLNIMRPIMRLLIAMMPSPPSSPTDSLIPAYVTISFAMKVIAMTPHDKTRALPFPNSS